MGAETAVDETTGDTDEQIAPTEVDTDAEWGHRDGDDAVDEAPDEEGEYFALVDPFWEPEGGQADGEPIEPPLDAVVGVWEVHDDELGAFRTNPQYAPRDASSPTDPVDALVRLMAAEQLGDEPLRLLLGDWLFEQGMNGDGRPLVVGSPDGVRCHVVTTSEAQRRRSTSDSTVSPEWRRVELGDVVSSLPDDVDLLINPDGPAPMRLFGDFVRSASLVTDEEREQSRVEPPREPAATDAETAGDLDADGADGADGPPMDATEADDDEVEDEGGSGDTTPDH